MSTLAGQRATAIRLGLSFVDVVSGGFGAAFFLFLIFATLPFEEEPTHSGGSHYVDIVVTWHPWLVYLNLIVEHSSASGTVRRLDLTDHRRFRIEHDGSVSARTDGESHRFWDQAMAAGVARRGTAALRDGADDQQRATWLRLTRPCPGELTLRLAPDGVHGSILVTDDLRVHAQVHLTIADATGPRSVTLEEVVIRESTEQGYKESTGDVFRVHPEDSGHEPSSLMIEVEPMDIGDYCDKASYSTTE